MKIQCGVGWRETFLLQQSCVFICVILHTYVMLETLIIAVRMKGVVATTSIVLMKQIREVNVDRIRNVMHSYT